jgi:hypothetical protein
MRTAIAIIAGCIVAALNAPSSVAVMAQEPSRAAQASDCVTIGTPNPGVVYHFTRTQSNSGATQYSQQWETVTKTGSRVKTTGPTGTQIQVNEHRIVDEVAVLDRTSKRTPQGGVIESTSFKPGVVSDPAFRVCAGRSWQIPPSTATFQTQQRTATAQNPAGTLKIVNIRERITVPAGTFDVVHYVRTSQSVDEYWKSTEHGVVVKHIATVAGITITETLTSIKPPAR